MISRRQTETTTYNEHSHHAQRGIAKYCLHTAYTASRQCLTTPPAPVKSPVSLLPAHLLFKSATTQI